MGPGAQADVRVQTNGVGLDDSYLRLFNELGIQIGVSLDGGAEAHDRHCRFSSGRGSHAAVTAGLDRLTRPSFRHLFSGLLCTIDLRNDPVETYKALAEFDPPKIDFLLPHGTWSSPPPGRLPVAPDTPYADWLIEIFDHWYPAGAPGCASSKTSCTCSSGRTHRKNQTLGLSPTRIAVIETDGAIEQADSLKVAYHGAGDDRPARCQQSAGRGAAAAGRGGQATRVAIALNPACRGCDIRRVCGAGLYAHRYRAGTGFYNPSVYCPDLMKLIGAHPRDRASRYRRTPGEAGHCMTERYHAIPRDLFNALAGRGRRPGDDRSAGRSRAQ